MAVLGVPKLPLKLATISSLISPKFCLLKPLPKAGISFINPAPKATVSPIKLPKGIKEALLGT